MSVQTYELRLWKGSQVVHQVPPFAVQLDMDQPDDLRNLLTRHLLAGVDRASDRREKAHLYRVDVHKVDGQYQGYGQPVIRWSLPIAQIP